MTFFNSINCILKSHHYDVDQNESVLMTSFPNRQGYLNSFYNGMQPWYGHVTCDEISLILELGSNLIYYFGTNERVSLIYGTWFTTNVFMKLNPHATYYRSVPFNHLVPTSANLKIQLRIRHISFYVFEDFFEFT